MMESVEVPGWFKIGISFRSKWIADTDIEVVDFNQNYYLNSVKVKLIPDHNAPAYRQVRHEGWILSHVLIGFEHGDYALIEK